MSMKKFFSTLIIGALVCFLTVEGAYDCNDLLKQKKNSLDDYIICMSAIRYIEINDDNIKNVATLVKDCSEKIDAYDLKSDHSCLPNQAKQISQLDSIVVDFMKCATESRHEDDYLANYLFCHAEMMSKYNNDFNQKEERNATTQELFGGYIGEENEDDFDYEYVVPVEDEDD